MSLKKKTLFWVWSLIIVWIIVIALQKPSLERNWSVDQEILADIDFSDNQIEVKNIRDFEYRSVSDYTPKYYDETFDLDSIESVYYIIEPFSDFDGPAHTMLSFGFENGSYIVVSSEIRKEKWESFSPWLWLINTYEMVYIIWSERDLIKLRANYRKDDVFLYPIQTSQANMKNLFISVLKRADILSKQPEFYNTLTNTCTTSILDHVNELRVWNDKKTIQWSKQIFLPSHSDQIAYDAGFIDTDLSLEEARKYYQINELSQKYAQHEEYSQLIRKQRK